MSPAEKSLEDHLGVDQFKDAVLNRLAERANIAQFASFAPGSSTELRFVRIRDNPVPSSAGVEEAVEGLMQASPESSVNVRSFLPNEPKGGEFLYGLTKVADVVAAVRRLAQKGVFTIVNETVDVDDGGISGVCHGGVLEFAPGDTPRCVEKPGTVSIEQKRGLQMLELVYGFPPALGYDSSERVEFSIHPVRKGLRNGHTIVWELEQTSPLHLEAQLRWPNRFSRAIGDKAFGLIVAHLLNLPVPMTTVVSRLTAPFVFGTPTGSSEPWTRTCPREASPGLFSTSRGWVDPFELLEREDPTGVHLASVLSQEAVDAEWSGALVTGSDGMPVIEGVKGFGNEFMLGTAPPEPLPQDVVTAVSRLHKQAQRSAGSVKIEWVYDGSVAWLVQLHINPSLVSPRIVFPGEASAWHTFDVTEGIDQLRRLIQRLTGTGEGVVLRGAVGITSHLGDLLRRAAIPSRLEEPIEQSRQDPKAHQADGRDTGEHEDGELQMVTPDEHAREDEDKST
jgi:hypothetical protein